MTQQLLSYLHLIVGLIASAYYAAIVLFVGAVINIIIEDNER